MSYRKIPRFRKWIEFDESYNRFGTICQDSQVACLWCAITNCKTEKKVKNFHAFIAKNSRIRMIPNISKLVLKRKKCEFSNWPKSPSHDFPLSLPSLVTSSPSPFPSPLTLHPNRQRIQSITSRTTTLRPTAYLHLTTYHIAGPSSFANQGIMFINYKVVLFYFFLFLWRVLLKL